ncbi:MAG: hypothetical protein EAZ47_10075 [Bacteroidetes bacterium]|nr:MAG: hypothetical protein EAY72_06370 [Bacteroidota bacterium]TAF91384.1 MAG: hypothetical protein EAZ47_10075 [Bacteroidota bacterium]
MKKNIISFCSCLAVFISLTGCEKNLLNERRVEQYLNPTTTTQVRIIHALSANAQNTVTPVTATTAPPALNFFANGVLLNGVSTAAVSRAIGYGGTFPGTAILLAGNINSGNLFDYAVIPGGNVRIAGVLNRLTGQTPADTVLASSLELENGKRYSVIAGDTIPFQRFFAFEDNFVNPDTANYTVRFINLAVNLGNGVNGYDVYSRRRQATIVSGVTYRNASPWIEGIFTTNDTLEIRPAGAALTSTPVAAVNGFAPVRSRVYTFVLRGVPTLAAPRNLAVAGYLNR